jgi:hypothetical protein
MHIRSAADNPSKTPRHALVQQGGQTMRLAGPPPEALEEIQAHLADAHGWTEFAPARDVASPASTPADACVAYLPATGFARARFICACCNGGIYVIGQPSRDNPARCAETLHPHPTRGVVRRHGARDSSALALLVREWSGYRLGQA